MSIDTPDLPTVDDAPPDPSPPAAEPVELIHEPTPDPTPEPVDDPLPPAAVDLDPPTRSVALDPVADVNVRDASKREIDVRLLPWDTTIETLTGPEEFARGAFAGTPGDGLYLMGLEHEAHLGIGQDGRPTLARRPVGRSSAVWEDESGAHATFRVARTQSGDEVLALAADRIVSGVSVEFVEVPGGTQVITRGGRRVRRHVRVAPSGASLTYRPAYGALAAVLAVRSQGDAPVTETLEVPAAGTALSPAITGWGPEDVAAAIHARMAAPNPGTEMIEAAIGRIEALEDRARSAFALPGAEAAPAHPDDFGRGHWAQLVMKVMSGDTVPNKDLQARVAAELITTDNLGVVPPAYLNELIGVIDPTRPFLASTRRLNTPSAGMQLTVPVLATKPTVGVQAAEKDELASTLTSITTTNFNPITVGGYGDISLQLLKRSDPSYLELYVDLLAEAYAIMADDKAVDALLAAAGVHNGGTVDPEDGLQFGDAWANASAVSRRLVPDTIWMSSAAVAGFIDAKSNTTNLPLYANLAASFTAAGGVGGTVSGLRPVHVPALDDEAADIIVGPSRGFGWCEDGTYTLQVDVPAKAGRDVGLVGMIWYAPLYPAAFTRYALGS